MLRHVETDGVARELPVLGLELALLDVPTTRGVEHLHAPALTQDDAVELADRLHLEVGAEQVLEGELVVEDRRDVRSHLAVELRVVPVVLGGSVQLGLGLLVLLHSLRGAAPRVDLCPRAGESADVHRGHSFQRTRTASQ